MTAATLASSDILHDLDEHFAAGYMEAPDASPMRRWSRAVRRRFERQTLPPYGGQLLYPAGPRRCDAEDSILSPSFSFTWAYNDTVLAERLSGTAAEERQALLALRADLRQLEAQLQAIASVHTVGGRGYTHSIPNYGRILREGLSAHAERIGRQLARARQAGDAEAIDLYLGLEDVMAGIECWHGRILQHLREEVPGGVDSDSRRRRLIAALERVPFEPARDFFEAAVAYNFTYYLDDCDNPGRVDLELSPFYERGLTDGSITFAEAVELIGCMWENCDVNNGWSAGIGGTSREGEAAYGPLTVACLKAAEGRRRPNLQLHVRRDMPDEVWDAALNTIATGCGLPALHNEEAFCASLRDTDLGVSEEDLGLNNGGGCTETMIHGLSNVGSLDAGINLPLILAETLSRELASAGSFEDLFDAYRRDVATAIDEVTHQVSADQESKSRLRPQPMRSLLIDDCIDNGLEYNAGGARYNWSVINVAGLATVVDSLAAVREVVFEKEEETGARLRDILLTNFDGEETFRRRLAQCPRFGNDDDRADRLAAEVSEFVFRQLLRHTPWRGGRFLPSCLMFTTYARAGEPVTATPDGRRDGEPIADSAGPHQGRDRSGPTAMLKSAAAIPHRLAPGTLVVNARFTRDFFNGEEQRGKLRNLVRTYFGLGGMQLQINVVDQAVLEDAIAHPERHEDLIVRVGGFSDYFNHLSEDLKRAILERTEHGG